MPKRLSTWTWAWPPPTRTRSCAIGALCCIVSTMPERPVLRHFPLARGLRGLTRLSPVDTSRRPPHRTISTGSPFDSCRPMAARTNPPHQNKADMPVLSSLFLLDRHGVITGWTGVAETASGYPRQELRGVAFDRLFTTGAPAGGVEAALRVAQWNDRFSGTGWFTLKDGSRLQALLVGEPGRGAEGGIPGVAATVGDPAAQRHSETAPPDGEPQFRMPG